MTVLRTVAARIAVVLRGIAPAEMVLLFAVVGVHWVVRRMLCRRAMTADAALAAADRDAREDYVHPAALRHRHANQVGSAALAH